MGSAWKEYAARTRPIIMKLIRLNATGCVTKVELCDASRNRRFPSHDATAKYDGIDRRIRTILPHSGKSGNVSLSEKRLSFAVFYDNARGTKSVEMSRCASYVIRQNNTKQRAFIISSWNERNFPDKLTPGSLKVKFHSICFDHCEWKVVIENEGRLFDISVSWLDIF